MRQQPATADWLAAKVADGQHGVLTIAQLRSAGLSSDAVKRRTQSGRLHRIHRGVYAVGRAGLTREAKWMAAVLACDAALSHRSAAALWGLLPARSGPVDVSIAGIGGREKRRGVRIHRSRTLTPAQVTKRTGIPATTPARTIADLRDAMTKRRSGAVSPRELRHAIRQADVLGLRINAEAASDRTRSELERLFLRLCRQHSLPTPEVNVWVDSLLVDFLWPKRKLIVETDGYRYHRGRAAFEDDRDRDLTLKALGYEVLRLSYRQIAEKPARVADVLDGLLRNE